MSFNSGFDLLRFRDGVSRQERTAKALDPDYFAVDERSLQDFFTFALQYAKTLIYYNRNNEDSGDDWSAFLTGVPKDEEEPNNIRLSESELNEIIAYLKNPAYFDHQPGKKARFSKPHFALFLTFLDLLREAQVQMNDITRRQLDFYYQQALGLQRQSDRPDQAHILAQLEPEVDQILIPKGTLLSAGEDDDGDPILYQTEEEILANQARITQLKSLYLDKEVNTLFSIREFEKETANPVRVLVELLNIVYRQPGTENTPRNYPENRPTDREMDRTLIDHLDKLHAFIIEELHLRPTAFQHLIELFKAWENPLNWKREGKHKIGEKGGGINDYLAKAASRKNGDVQFDIGSFADLRNFDDNIERALGVDIKGNLMDGSGANIFEGRLDGVDDFYKLYDVLLRQNSLPLEKRNPLIRQNIEQIITNLGFDELDNNQGVSFESMMKIRTDVLGYLEEIIRILSEAMRQASLDPGQADPRAYTKDATLANIFIKVCRLDNNVTSSSLQFEGWDKELLTISCPGDSLNIEDLITDNGDRYIEGGFTLERLGPGSIPIPPEEALEKELSIELAAVQPGSFLKVSYAGEAEKPKATLVLNAAAAQEVMLLTDTSGLLKITLKQDATPIKKIIETWRESSALTLDFQGAGSIKASKTAQESSLSKDVAADLPGVDSGSFLKATYTGEKTLAKVSVVWDETIADEAVVEVGITTSELVVSVRLKQENTPLATLQKAWINADTLQPVFTLEHRAPSLTIPDPGAPLLELNREWKTKHPDRAADFLDIRYAGPSLLTPKLKIIVDEFLDNPAAFEFFGEETLIIKMRNDRTPAGVVKEAWQKNAQKGDFFLEVVGSDTFGVDKSSVTEAISLEPSGSYYKFLSDGSPEKHFKIQYDDTGQARIEPKVKIEFIQGAADRISFSPPAPDKELTITFNEENVPIQDILDAWDSLPSTNKGRFSIKYLPVMAMPVSEGVPLEEFSTFLIKEFSHLFPGNDLRAIYRGLHASPKVAIVKDVGLAANTVKVVSSYKSFSDEYFKIKGEQLAQLESYFKMQAEEFFFIRNLFVKPLGRDWPYKDPAWKWRQADDLLEAAHRNLFGSEATPEIVRWKNIFIAQDATQVLVPAFDEEEEFPRWKTFGKKPNPDIPTDKEVVAIGDLGFILASSSLSLSEGVRTLTLRLTFDERTYVRSKLYDFFRRILFDPDEYIAPDAIIESDELVESTEFYPFTIQVSTEKEWVTISKWKRFQLGPEGAAFMEITLLLTEEIEALAPVDDSSYPSPWPALKLLLNRDEIEAFSGDSSVVVDRRRPYELLADLLLVEAKLDIKVEKLTNILVQTPLGNIDPTAPFEPFGLEPRRGDSFFIAHSELAAQKLNKLRLNLNWKNFSAGKITEYYEPYGHPLLISNFGLNPITDASFEVEVVLRDAHRKLPLLKNPNDDLQKHPLFASNAAPAYNGVLEWKSADDPDNPETFSPNNTIYLRKPNPQIPEDDIRQADRYLQIKLADQDFLHDRYVGMLTWLGLSGAGKLTTETDLNVEDGVVQLQGVPLKGLQSGDFSITASNAAFTLANDGYDEVNKKLTVAISFQKPAVFELPKDEAGNFLKITYTGASNAPFVSITDTKPAEGAIGFLPVEPGKLTIEIPPEGADGSKPSFDEATMIIWDAIEAKEGFFIEIMPDGAASAGLAPGEFIPNLTDFKIAYLGPFILPEPYTPVLEGISVDYETSVQIDLPVKRRIRFEEDVPIEKADPFVYEDKAFDHLLHLHPFGFSQVEKTGEWIKIAEELVDRDLLITEKFSFQFIPRYEHEGELYLGVENLNPPQTLTMLFQMAEGSSNPDLPTAEVYWSYLAGHNWVDLPAKSILKDTTNGLQKSGILQLAVPAGASIRHHRMPDGIHWLRARVKRFSGSLNDTIAIHCQAVRAIWIDQGLDAAHLSRALPPETITEPVEPIPGLLSFIQPYSSFGGKQKEKAPAFYRRVSERLRHKNRGMTMWDYERLTLEKYPDIYKAKALATDLLDPGAAPGAVTIIVIPDIRYRRPFDPFEPKVPQGRLKEIQRFLQSIAPPFARIQVKNPRFDYLHVRAPVSFRDKNNFGFYAGQLERELKQYLSPWAFEEASEIAFGKEIYLSMVVHFIETRPYVDFVDQPKLILQERRASTGTIHPVEGFPAAGVDGNVQLRGPDVVLVSSPEHTIDFLDTSIPPEERILSGIGYAKLDLDFVVAADSEGSSVHEHL